MNQINMITTGSTTVSVRPFASIDEFVALADTLNTVSGNEAELALASRLQTACGDLAATIINGNDSTGDAGFIEEAADVIIYAAMLGVKRGMEGSQLRAALHRRVTDIANDVVRQAVIGTLNARGLS